MKKKVFLIIFYSMFTVNMDYVNNSLRVCASSNFFPTLQDSEQRDNTSYI